MFMHRVKSGMGLSLPRGAQEGVAAIYTHTKKSSHSNSLRASLDDETNPSFWPGTPTPTSSGCPQPPASLLQLLSRIPRRLSWPSPQGFTCPASPGHVLPTATVSLSHLVSHLAPCPPPASPTGRQRLQGKANPVRLINRTRRPRAHTHEGREVGQGLLRPFMPMSCHSCPERSHRVQERAGVDPHCSAYTPLPGPHAAKLLVEGRELPRPLQPGEQHFRMEGGLTPRGCPRVTPQRPHAWAQPEGRDRATRAWALGLAPHAPPAAATNPEGSAVSPRPSETCLQKPGRALLSPSTPARLCSPAAPHHCPPRPQTGPGSLRPGAVDSAGTGTQPKETEETHFVELSFALRSNL